MARNVLSSSLQNASFSIVFQIFCRCITFGINAFIIRHVGRDVLGVMNVRLLLLESTLLFLSREAISRAAMSSTSQQTNKSTWPQLVNQIWITVPICGFLCIPCLYIWLDVLTPVTEQLFGQYKFGCIAIALSCVVEMCAEMPIFACQVFCFVKVKVIIDALHIVIRSVVFIIIVLNKPDIAILAFAIAQICSILTIVIGNYLFFFVYIKNLNAYRIAVSKKEITAMPNSPYQNMDDFPFRSVREMLPGVLPNMDNVFNAELKILVLSFAKQGVLKQILTEGEKYVMSVSPVMSFSEQATFDIVNNMGSLAARFIFRPIEDSTYFYFTQTIARDIKLSEQPPEKVLQASKVLSNVCRVVTSIGLLGFVFGQSFAETALLLYGGADFVFGGLPGNLLRWHSLAIVLLAVNGITEGYMFATNTSKDIDKYNYYMAIFSITFLLLSYQLTNTFGPVGFILANCTNMFLRILYSTYFIRRQYRESTVNPFSEIFPGKLFLATLAVMGVCCKVSEAYFLDSSIVCHLLVGAGAVAITLAAWCFDNLELLQIGLQRLKHKKIE